MRRNTRYAVRGYSMRMSIEEPLARAAVSLAILVFAVWMVRGR